MVITKVTSARIPDNVSEALKDCRVVSIIEERSIDGGTSWRVSYVCDPDLEFTSLDDTERKIRAWRRPVSVSIGTGLCGRASIEIEWL